MARQTRQQRRERRAQQEPALAGGPPQRPPVRPVAQAGGEPERRRAQREERERHIPGSGSFRFVQEAIAELKKVEWPNQKAVISGTAVVLIACVIVGAFLWLNDELWRYVVQHVLLR
ncbi:MAG: preprotein translocase subunit SecE [Actinobacteria bacterium]|jgi:preprotein translocase SecE subunit|nr:MAG: preprotein translocase subunit SecE [Actinomycetota bacterium]